MNYLEQIVAFQRWKDVNPLPASAIALWYELMAACNKAGWPEEFTIQNAMLQATAGLSRKEFDRARQMLINLRRIHYGKSKRVNTAGNYTLIPFSIVQKGQQNGQQEGHREEHRRDNKKDNYKDLKDKQKRNETETVITGDGSPLSTKFTPPTLEEVISYCEERKNNVDASKWFDFYASKGWMVGKNKMKDWRAAVRTWENTRQSAGSSRKETSFDVLQRMMRDGEGDGPTGRIEVNHDMLG